MLLLYSLTRTRNQINGCVTVGFSPNCDFASCQGVTPPPIFHSRLGVYIYISVISFFPHAHILGTVGSITCLHVGCNTGILWCQDPWVEGHLSGQSADAPGLFERHVVIVSTKINQQWIIYFICEIIKTWFLLVAEVVLYF